MYIIHMVVRKKSFDAKSLVRTLCAPCRPPLCAPCRPSLCAPILSTLVRTLVCTISFACVPGTRCAQAIPLCAPCARTLVRTMVGTDLVRTMLVAHVQVMVFQAVATAQGVHKPRLFANHHMYRY